MSVTRKFVVQETTNQGGINELFYALKARGCDKPPHELWNLFNDVLNCVAPPIKAEYEKEIAK